MSGDTEAKPYSIVIPPPKLLKNLISSSLVWRDISFTTSSGRNANWYVELTKEVLYSENESEKAVTRSVLLYTLDKILRLLHRIMSSVTEEIFAQYAEDLIVTAALSSD